MKNIVSTYPTETWQEDAQTFVMSQEWQDHYAGLPDGTPAWCEWFHYTGHPGYYDPPGHLGYRVCCTANSWLGGILVVHILDIKNLWNHDVGLEYQDLYHAERAGGDPWLQGISPFARDAWEMYRPLYGGPIWQP